MPVKIIILDFNAFTEKAKELRMIWRYYITAEEWESYDCLIDAFYFYPTARKLFPHLFDLVKQLDRLTTREKELIELEVVEELRKIEEEKERIKGKIWEEAESIWSTIDTKVIDSFKDLIRNVTGSDELADIYGREVESANIVNLIRKAKYEHDYREMEHIICELLYDTTVRWFREILRLAGI